MECSWDAALLQRGDELPPELLDIIRSGSNEQYLEAITKAALDSCYTYTLFTHCEDIFAHVCATLRHHGSLASSIATLGRIVPFASYLSTFAEKLLRTEHQNFRGWSDPDEIMLFLLGLFRLLRNDWRTFKQYVDLAGISELLHSPRRSMVYLVIRILQLCLDGADHWFESMVRKYLGDDSPESAINGQWDDIEIDYRFLTLWEQERHERVGKLLEDAKRSASKRNGQGPARVLSLELFDRTVTTAGGICLPRNAAAENSPTPSGTAIVETATIRRNLRAIAEALKSSQPLLLTGLAGSGKTMLARHVAQRVGKLSSMVTLHLNEQSDAKLLIGVYTTGDTPGSFLWKPGVLTTAVQEGRWVLIEDLDRAPNEVMGTLLPLIEKGELLIPNRKQTIRAPQGFRIIATVRSTVNHRGKESNPLRFMLGARFWQNTQVEMPSQMEQREIASKLFPSLNALLPQFIRVYDRIQASRQRSTYSNQAKAGTLRPISAVDLLKWCSRVANLLGDQKFFASSDLDDIFLEAADCFLGALPSNMARTEMSAVIAEELHIDPQRRDFLLAEREVRYAVDKSQIQVGRYSLPRAPQAKKMAGNDSTFSTNPHTSRMLERVAAAAVNREPLLLVGETGVGKTTAVQHLASHLGKRLVPFNLSQQSEAGDLLGGFKPVNARTLIVPMKDEFDSLFTASFSMSKNQDFLELLGKQMAKANWRAVCKLWQRAFKMVDQQRSASVASKGETPSKKRKVDTKRTIDFQRWDAFRAKVSDMEKRLAAGSDTFAFSFVEGSIVKAVRNGDWILLDEINLASMDTLESIADLLDPSAPSILLTEAGDVQRIDAHPEFRIFAAMNPATDVGKKDLPPGIRSRFTELYVESPDKDIRSLQSIVRSYLRHETASDQSVPSDVSALYQKIIALSEQSRLVDGAGQRPHFSLRTLTRTLSYAKHIAPLCTLRRALYEGFQMSFLTFLDAESARLVQALLELHLFGKRTNIRAELQKALRKPADGHEYVQGWPGSKHWVRRGISQPEDQPHYILTPFIRSNIENLVRATSTRQFPVLIQGPTSSGKTSMIEYLAKRTGHTFVRINNHEHTDLQEYLGTYVSGTDGKLQFQEGILVKALREGHWIVLDELNLAPTDVLEALNRLLDDNRELLVPETQEVVRPHESFMLFATQNPAGLYGGRKTLSRAFRNRFLELHFDDIPIDELQEILHRRTQQPDSRCKRIVAVYRELSVLRQESRVFEQKSFATLRDLFRWALRPNDTIEQLAANGFMLLAERVRKAEERQILKEIIEKAMSANGPRVKIDEAALYAGDCDEVVQYQRSVPAQGVVWTKAMRRLYVLVRRAIANNEPVLLVGETGCGKTTVCQMLADAFCTELLTVNAHQNTESGDLIGSQRPIRNRAVIEASLRQQLLASPLLQSSANAADQTTEALLVAYDHALSTLENEEEAAHLRTQAHVEIQATRTRFKALFEWADGSLVQAMRSGSFFLLDEISLADDSVLERINSVLEPQRSILLAEKGSLDSFVTAASGFQFFATMNPGGDYGKRELSPALRNRFTEIWVPSLNDAEDVSEIVTAKLVTEAKPFAGAMVAFAQWFKYQYNTSASSSVSIRDALAWVSFINPAVTEDVSTAVVNGASMVYIDTLGANPAGLMTITNHRLDEERQACLVELGRLLQTDAQAIYSAPIHVRVTNDGFNAGEFRVPKRQATSADDIGFSFDPPTTKVNTMRVVRALQLPKPVMLEGNPGVGKTALVTAIADAVRVHLTRINLSEQTDLIDLFGSDVPVEGVDTGSFTWRDAPFLKAMKNGEWVLLDEMNLASQSVLEGLNACLDHRGEVFVPELGQTFTRHPDFRLFAAQNPHHQGGGRKGLPASFVNRFTVVYADAFRSEDLLLICRRRFPSVDDGLVAKAVQFVEQLEQTVTTRKAIGANGGPWEFNLRDVSRWLALASGKEGLLKAGSARDMVDFLFSQRFRSQTDRITVSEIFDRVFGADRPRSDLFPSVSSQVLQLGLGLLKRRSDAVSSARPSASVHVGAQHTRILESMMLCIDQNWPVILTGSSGAGKTALIERLAFAVGAPLVTIAMNAETDAMDLVGGYEQFDPHRQTFNTTQHLQQRLYAEFRRALTADAAELPSEFSALLRRCETAFSSETPDLEPLVKALETSRFLELQQIAERLRTASSKIDKARFEWIDGLLVDALREGKWLVLDNANLCSSSVLDRLNSLLESNGSLIVNEHSAEDGSARMVQPHTSFRIFLTLDPRYGELSRAMRNRAVELHLSKDPGSIEQPGLDPLFTESAVTRFRSYKAAASSAGPVPMKDLALMLQDHLAACDQPLLERFRRQVDMGLYGGAGVLPMPPPELQTELLKHSSDFHQATISQLQGPADFASVQTLHPLNNQPLICTSPHTLSNASTLAVGFDLRVTAAYMQHLLRDLQADSTAIKHLRRVERAWTAHARTAASKSSESQTVQLLAQVVASLIDFSQSSPFLPSEALQSLRSFLGHLSTIWLSIRDALKNGRCDQTTITSFFAIARKLIRSADSPALSSILPSLSATFNLLTGGSESIRGQACTTLWHALRPWMPPTMNQLKEILDFEELVGRFDEMSQTSRKDIDEAASLRVQLAQTLRVARSGGRDLSELTGKLHGFGLTSDNGVAGDSIGASHFSPVFERLNQRFAAVHEGRLAIDNIDIAKLEALAQRPTTQSRLALKPIRGHFLSARSPHAKLEERSADSDVEALFHHIVTAGQVPLAALENLTAETRLLGKVFSSQAHLLNSSELDALDQCLEAVFSEFLSALQSSEVEELRAIAVNVSQPLDLIGREGAVQLDVEPSVNGIVRALSQVGHYLRCQLDDFATRSSSAAAAWSSFALVALYMYIPATAFDPALEPILRLNLHRRQRQGLKDKLDALRALRAALTGDSKTLRARVIEEDIAALGKEPEAAAICRPSVSELSKLQSEFDALSRTLEPYQQSLQGSPSPEPLDSTALANIERTYTRLRTQYRAYDDLTDPALLLLDCLLIGHDLSVHSAQNHGKTQAVDQIIPFLNACPTTWLQDGAFLDAAASASNVDEELQWLSALALRCKSRPLQHCSHELRARVADAFERFYAAWKSQLTEDQKQNAAKSSLYKFKGVEEDQSEPSQEDLEELFPTAGQADKDPSAATRHNLQEYALTVATLHACIHGRPTRSHDEAAEALLRQWASHSESEPLRDGNTHTLPAAIFTLGELNNAISEAKEAHSNYNVYTDSNLSEAKKLSQLLQRTQRRFEDLQRAWPEHATPGDVLVLSSQIVAIPWSAPLPRFFPLTEKLHATVTEWQKIASREYSAAGVLDELTNTIIGWRQLELSTWAGIFKREWDQCESAAASWWFVAYESIVSSSQDLEVTADETRKHSEDLLKTLSGFMSVSGLGEYSARLELLRGFEASLTLADDNQGLKRILRDALRHFIAFYAHYDAPVAEALAKGRADLEKEAKNVIQVASWKDRNIDVLRQSAHSSHRKLLKLVKKYRSLLAQPVTTILQAGMPAKSLDRAKAALLSLPVADHVQIPISVTGLEAWDDRADRFKNAERTAELLRSKVQSMTKGFDGRAQLHAFSTQLEKDIAGLRKATPSILTEDNKTLVSHLKTRKRRLFADVLKEARAMGFQSSMSMQALASQASSEQTLAHLSARAEHLSGSPMEESAFELYRLLDTMTTVRQSARNHIDDLTPAEVSRSISFLESMLQQSTLQYRGLDTHVSDFSILQLATRQFSNFTVCDRPELVKSLPIAHVRESLTSLLVVMPVSVRTLRYQRDMAVSGHAHLIESLMGLESRAHGVLSEIEVLRTLPPNIEAEAQRELRQAYKQLQQDISDVVNEAITKHPETGPVAAQLLRWVALDASNPCEAAINGHAHTDRETWSSQLLNVVDTMLGAVESAEKIRSPTGTEGSWLLSEQKLLNRTLDALRVPSVANGLQELVSQLRHLNNDSGHDHLSKVAAMCSSVLPVVQAYTKAVASLVELQASHHAESTRTAFKLATIFTTLCQKGFCSPSEKPDSNDTSEGNVESGTGLGDGEGAEDISKEIAPDEDLSEMAQEANKEQSGDGIEEQKDAVDMADEDLQGETGDSGDAQEEEDGAASGDEAEDGGEMDEESGDVDDQGPAAVDEKMWDGGKDEAQREKETDAAKGQANDNDAAAGKESNEDRHDQDENGEADDETAAGADDTEEVQRESAEQIDPHVRDEENLELPEDMVMDQDPRAGDDDGSDLESMSDGEGAVSEVERNDSIGEAEQEPGEEQKEDQQEAEDEQGQMEAGEEAADADAASDVLMKDDDQDAPNADPQSNAVVPPEAGSGPDQAEANEEDGGKSKSAGGPAGEQEDQEEDAHEPESAGAQADGDASKAGQDDIKEDKLPFKQIGDALHEWYNQNADIEKAQQPDRSQTANEAAEQPASTQFQHLPNEDAHADTQAIGTASAEESMALDKEQALPVNNEEEPKDLPFQESNEEAAEKEQAEGEKTEAMQLEPSDKLRQEAQSNAFVGEPQGDDVDMADELEQSEENEVDDMDQQLLETHISREDEAETSIEEARKLWVAHEESTRNLALVLTEHLRLILQPTQATKMRGDFRTGKRLNIKRIIPYIASSYKRDKIWMRRSVPSKRAYQIMLAIDDSESMMESESRHLAFETLAMVTKSLSMLEVGELSVVGFGEEVKVAHDFGTPFTSDAGAEIFKRLTFTQNKTNVRKLLAESIELFRAARLKASSSASDLWQLQLIVSDGICEDHPSIRQLVRQAHEERIMIVFVVVDAAGQNKALEPGTKQSILDLQTAEFAKDASGEMQLKMVKYLDTFPFRYYLIVRDVQELPGVLAGALRQWFAEVVETGG